MWFTKLNPQVQIVALIMLMASIVMPIGIFMDSRDSSSQSVSMQDINTYICDGAGVSKYDGDGVYDSIVITCGSNASLTFVNKDELIEFIRAGVKKQEVPAH